MKWKTVPIGSICRLINGKAFKPSDWSEEGHPIIRIQNLNDSDKPFNYWNGPLDKQVLVEPGDLLFAWSGTPGTSFGAHVWNGPSGVLNQHIFRVDFHASVIDKNWWAGAVNFQLNELISLAHGGVGLKHVTKGMVDRLEIPLPPLAEQKRLTAILGEADALSRLRVRSLDRFNALGHAIFHEMFGANVAKAHAAANVCLGDVVDKARGISYGVVQRGADVDGGVPLIRISNFTKNIVSTDNIVRTSAEIDAGYKRTKLRGGELLVSIRGSVGNVAIVPPTCSDWNVSREVAVVPLLQPTQAEYFWRLLQHDRSRSFIMGEVRGVAQSGINLADLRTLPVPEDFEMQASSWLPIEQQLGDLARSATFRFAQVDALRSALQHRAFRGEL